MFASRIQAQAKSTVDSTASFGSKRVLRRTRNECSGHGEHDFELADVSIQRRVSGARWDFGEIPVFPSDPTLLPVQARHVVREALDSPGKLLDRQTRSFFEPRFEHDFGRVRIHTGAKANESARLLNAQAYTVGRDVVFSDDCYAPHSFHGSRLLAHELAHVIQQERGGPALPDGSLERSADAAASAVVAGGGPTAVSGASAPGIARQPQSEPPVVGIHGPVPPYLRNLEMRLERLVDKQVRFWAEQSGPIAEIRNKYPPYPLREDAILDIPAPDFSRPLFEIDLNAPGGRFRLHSQLYGRYELVDYHQPWVIIARDGIGYVLPDSTFAWMFGQEFPELYEEFEGPLKFRHEHPFQTLFAEMVMSSIPLPINPQAFIATFIMPFLPGFAEFAAVPTGEVPVEAEGGPAPEATAAPPVGAEKPVRPPQGVKPPIQPKPEPATPTAILPNGKAVAPDSYSGGYYGTTDPPEVVIKSGLPARGNDWRLLEHVHENPNSAFRGTTTVPSDPVRGQGAAYWAGEGGYVYEIRHVPTWDVNRALEGRVTTPEGFGGNIMRGENEYVIPARVPRDKIVRYGVVKKDRQGRLYVEWTGK